MKMEENYRDNEGAGGLLKDKTENYRETDRKRRRSKEWVHGNSR